MSGPELTPAPELKRGAVWIERFVLIGLVLAGLCLAGCDRSPTKEEFLSKEMQCLQCYCASNAVAAETALLDCARYADACQKAGIDGIQYDEVFARIYGRLYIVERHLGRSEAAEEYLQMYARFHALSSSFARRTGRPYGEMERLIERKFDDGLQVAWRTQ